MDNIDWLKDKSRYEDVNLGALENKAARDLYAKTNEITKKFSQDMEGNFHFNTAIASSMELLNFVYLFTAKGLETKEEKAALAHTVKTMVLLLAPFIPHTCEELYAELGNTGSVFKAGWPAFDEKAIVKSSVEIVLQVNSKVRSRITVPAGLSREDMEALVHKDENILKHIQNAGTIRKIISIPDKLVNIVVK